MIIFLTPDSKYFLLLIFPFLSNKYLHLLKDSSDLSVVHSFTGKAKKLEDKMVQKLQEDVEMGEEEL